MYLSFIVGGLGRYMILFNRLPMYLFPFMGLYLGGLGRVVIIVCLGIVHQSPSLSRDRCHVKGLEVYQFWVINESCYRLCFMSNCCFGEFW